MAGTIDKRRLVRDAVRAERERPLPSVGRETVGIVRAVKDLLPVIRQLRTDGVRWAAIAEALTAQGIYPERDGRPVVLAPSRLTAIVSALEQRERKKGETAMARRSRPGLVAPESSAAAVKAARVDGASAQTVALSPELQRGGKSLDDTAPSYASEEDLRRQALTHAQAYLKD